MAGKSAVPLDEVIIEIKSKADGSTKSIDELAASLNNLKQSISGGFNNLNKLSKTLGELPTLMNKFDTTTFENLKRVSNELAQSLEPLANKMNQIAQGYSAFSKIQNTFGKSASTSTRYMKQQKSMLVALSNVARRSVSSFVKLASSISTGFGKKAVSDIKKFNSQFKQIFLSLLGTRTLFTMIRKAAAEYEAFDETLQKFSTNVWRAFGAQLAPVIEYTMELFKQFVRVIYSIVYALTGIDLIAKANAKAMAAWGKSSKDTLGNLQKFDDLNVVEFDKDKSGDDKSLIKLDKIDLSPIQKVIDWVRKLKKEIQEAWNSGEWYGVGEVFAEGVNQGITFVLKNMESIRDKLFSIANDFGQLLNGVITTLDWGGLAKLISNSLKTIGDTLTVFLINIDWSELGKGLNDFLRDFDAAGVIHSFMMAFRQIVIGFGDLLAELDYSMIGEKIGDMLIRFFTDISFILDEINWRLIGEKVREAIDNVDWEKVWDSIATAAGEALNGTNDLLSGLTGLDVKVFQDLEKSIVGIGIAIGTYKIIVFFEKLSVILSSASFLTAATLFGSMLGVLVGIDLVIKGIKEMLESPSWKAFWDILAGIALVVAGVAIALGGWVVAIVAAVVALVGMIASYLAEHWEEFTKWLSGIGDTIANWFSNIAASVSNWWSGVKEWWLQKFKEFGDYIDKKLIQPVLQFIEKLKNGIKEKINIIKDVFTNVKNWIKEKIADIKSVLSSVPNWIYNKMIKPVQDNFNKMKNKISEIWDSIKSVMKTTLNWLISKFENFLNNMISGINGLSSGLRKIGNKVFDIIGVDIKFNPISTVSLPRLETGTNEIPYEGVYHLHPGEAVVPKKYNPALGGGTNAETNEKLDRLIFIMENMDFTNVVNIGNERVYAGQQKFNKYQQNKYGTINIY